MTARPHDAAPDPRRWRTLSRTRRIGYSLLPGESFSYLLHLRPREWPIMVAHTSVGFVLAVGLGDAVRGERGTALLVALFAWVVCLNGGTLALNSAFDRDEGDVGYLDAPPPPPPRLAAVSLALMALGQAVALTLPPAFAVAYAACFAMSVLYSVPPVRLKAVAGADWVINIIGFGALTPFAGWASSGAPLATWAAWVIIAFALLFASLYPLTQIYQLAEDVSRGDRTLAAVVGTATSLRVAAVAAVLSFGAFGCAAAVARVEPLGWLGLLLAFGGWLTVLVAWLRGYREMSPSQHKRGMYQALVAWALTDVAVVVAFGVR